MYETTNISEAVLIASKTGISPFVSIIPYPTGTNCKVGFKFPGLSENYQISEDSTLSLSFSRLLLTNFEDYSRLQRCVQVVYRERGGR
jgi:hypothetical protein